MDEAQRSDDNQEPGDKIAGIRDRIEPEIERAKQQIEAGAERARQQVDTGIGRAGVSLESAAGRIRTLSSEQEGVPAEAGLRLAGEMGDAGTYLKEHSSREILNDIGAYVKKHPAKAIIGAVIAGFVVGRIMH